MPLYGTPLKAMSKNLLLGVVICVNGSCLSRVRLLVIINIDQPEHDINNNHVKK